MRLILVGLVGAAAALCTLPGTARGQIFVASYSGNTIGTYDAITGAVISASFIGVSGPSDLAVSSGNLFVSTPSLGRIGKYDAITGAVINSSFIGGRATPSGLAASGGDLFVATGTGFEKYNATTGTLTALNTSGGLSSGIALSGGNLLARWSDKISKYDGSTLVQLNSTFITGLGGPAGIAVSDGILFIANNDTNTIGKYDAITGAALDPFFITGGALSNPTSLAVSDGKLFVVNSTG